MGFKSFLLIITYQIFIFNCVQNQIDSTLLRNINSTFQRRAFAPGDIVMAGLFPVHFDHDPYNNVCEYLNEKTVQWVQAMIYTIEQINNRSDILPNITIGYNIRDTCNSASLGILRTINFIPDEFQNDDGTAEPDDDPPLFHCANDSNLAKSIVAGIIGARNSRVSIPIASLVSNFNLPQISYASTSPALNDHRRYKSFFRTVPSDKYQAMALVDIIKYFGWNYISVIAVDDSYGHQGLNQLSEQAKSNDICMAVVEYVSDATDTVTISRILHKIENHPKSNVVVVFTTEFVAVSIIQQAELRNLTGHVFISTDTWSNSLKFTRFNPAVIGGLIGLSLQGRVDPQFDEYLRTRDLCNNLINPWFVEMWRSKTIQYEYNINLDLPNDQCSISSIFHNKYSNDFYHQTSKVAYVMDAVKALAVAFHNTLECNSKYCPHIDLDQLNRTRLLSELANVTFRGQTNEHFRFTALHNGQPKYTIVNLQPDPTDKNTLKHVEIGSWSDRSLTTGSSLMIDDTKIIWNGNRPWYDIPTSNCSKDCPAGTVRIINSRDTCCWQCQPCTNLSISNKTNANTCSPCPIFNHPSDNHTTCLADEIEIVKPDSLLAISIYAVDAVILSLIFIIWVIFIKYRQTPIVKASNFAISNLLLFSITYCSIVPIIFLLPKSKMTCNMTVITFASSLTLTMMSIISKTKTIAGVFGGEFDSSNSKTKLYQLLQIVIPLSIFALEICACSIALYFDPVNPKDLSISNHKVHIVCSSKYEIALILSFIFLALSNIICIYLAFKTRKLPENFNEAKYICFTTLIMFCIMVTLTPSFFATSGPLQDGIAAFGSIAYVTAVLLCIFAKKIHIILFQPQLNCRKKIMLSIRSFSFANTPQNIGTPPRSNTLVLDTTTGSLDMTESAFCNKEFSSSKADIFSTAKLNHSATVKEK